MLRRGASTSHPTSLAGRSRPGPWLLLFVCAWSIRAATVFFAAGTEAKPTASSIELDQVSWNLAQGAGFSLSGPSGVRPTAVVEPVAPWVTSLVYRSVGHRYFVALLFQCAIASLVPLLLVALGGATFGGTIGRIAGWLTAASPLLLDSGLELRTANVFAALLLLALAFTAAWVKTPRPGRALGVGLTWGLACLGQATALLLPILVLAWGWVPLGLTVAPRDRARQSLLMLLGIALAVGPWAARNAMVLHAAAPITTSVGRALLDGNNSAVWDDPVRRGGAVDTRAVEPFASETARRPEPVADRLAFERAGRFLVSHVGQWPALAAAKLSRMWWPRSKTPDEPAAWGSREPREWTLALQVWTVFMLPLALWGLVRTVSSARRWFQSLTPLVILYLTAVSMIFFGSRALRTPAEPLMLLLVAVGIEDLRRRARTRGRGFRVIEGSRRADGGGGLP